MGARRNAAKCDLSHPPLGAFVRQTWWGGRPIGFSSLDQYLCMMFAQLTYRESLRDRTTSAGARTSHPCGVDDAGHLDAVPVVGEIRQAGAGLLAPNDPGIALDPPGQPDRHPGRARGPQTFLDRIQHLAPMETIRRCSSSGGRGIAAAEEIVTDAVDAVPGDPVSWACR